MPAAESDYIAHTNVSDYDMTVFYLSKKGYGTVNEIREWDTKQFLDAIEYEAIENAIKTHLRDNSE